MAYINDELNNNVRELFNLFFYRCYYSGENPIGCQYIDETHNKDKVLPNIQQLGICDFIVDEQDDKSLLISIGTYRPGIIVGYHGYLIDGIRKYLIDKLNKEIKINLVESKMFDVYTTKRVKIMNTELWY